MAISTYLELKTAIQNWAKRGDILDVVDDFIDLAESDIWQNLKTRDMEARAIAAAPLTDRYLALPEGFIYMRKLRVTSGGISYDLEYRAPESLDVTAGAGRPRSFTVTTQLEFDRIPDSAYEVEMQYFKSLTPLSAAAPSNAILTRFPAVYLYGSLFHFAQWAHHDKMLMQYSQLFDEEIKRANKIERRGRHGPAPAMKSEGSTP